MKCIGCNNEINTDLKFCKYCGTPIQKSLEANRKSEDMLQCSVCGAKVKSGNVFCTKCGTPITKAQNTNKNNNRKNGKKSKVGKIVKMFLVITLIAAIALITVVVLHFVNSKLENVDETTQLKAENEESFDREISEETVEETEDLVEAEETEQVADENSDESTVNNIDVEECVNQIREQYDRTVSSMSSDIYEKINVESGITAYYDNDSLKAIIATKGAANADYSCSYYYDEGELFFAYYEGNDAHRFYFQDDQLIRWRYSANALDSQNAINYDLENTSEYYRWESSVITNAMNLKDDWKSALADGNEAQEYILVGSDSRYISEAELDKLTKEEVKLARNEIYARNGRKFSDAALQNYFNQFDWYKPTIEPSDFKESMLNKYEIANRDLIVQYEKKHGYT